VFRVIALFRRIFDVAKRTRSHGHPQDALIAMLVNPRADWLRLTNRLSGVVSSSDERKRVAVEPTNDERLSMYLGALLLLMFVLPSASVFVERLVFQSATGWLSLVGRWFVFWAVGVRLLVSCD
jgi:hypothetical protein